jgi:hypothetical protein
LTFCVACLVWFAVEPLDSGNSVVRTLQSLSNPSGWLVRGSMWLALGLTMLSGWNYMWASRKLLRGR